MTLVDANGRVLGRWNVVDVLVGVVLLLLIPLLYGGFVLFRPATPSLIAVEPARMHAGQGIEITVRGANLRPYMRVSFNEHQGQTFLFSDPSKAVVATPAMPPGVYDVILYDQAQERARIANGLEVVATPTPATQLDLIGSFTGVTQPIVDQLKDGLSIDGLGTLLRVAKPTAALTRTTLGAALIVPLPSENAFNVDAVIRANCALSYRSGAALCQAMDTALMQDVILRPTIGNTGVLFQIDQIRTTAPMATVRVRARMGGDRGVLEGMRVGDRDARRGNPFAASGTIAAMDGVRSVSTSVALAQPNPQGQPEPFVLSDLAVRDVVLELPAQRLAEGWHYAGRWLLAGTPLTFTGPGYEVRGTILSAPVAGRVQP